MEQWPLQDAKNKFSQVVDRAITHGPQLVTRRGRAAVVILSMEEYQRLNRPAQDLAAFLSQSPLRGSGLALDRCDDMGREVEL